MNLLLTVYTTPAWTTFANACQIPVVTDQQDVKSGSFLISPEQQISAIPQIIDNAQHCWLAIVQAEYFLADAIGNGITLEAAASEWKELTNAVLEIHRQQRRRLKLFNVHQALAQPALFQSQLRPDLVIREFSPQSCPNNLALLAACQYVAQHHDLKKLNTTIQATVIPLCESHEIFIDIKSVLQQSNDSEIQISTVVKERDQILLHLQESQEQLENYAKASTSQIAALTTERDQATLHIQHIRAQLEENTSQLAVVSEQLSTMTMERDVTLVQLNQMMEENHRLNITLQNEEQKSKHSMLANEKQQAKEVANLEKELRKAKAQAANAEHANELLKEELKKIRSSTLWKATGPVRLLGRLVKKDNREREKLQRDIALILTSEYFDIEWYLKNYPDVAKSNMNPAEHYLIYGAAEGRLPGPFFDGNWYSQHYPDVAAAGVNPLLHFVMFGQQEGRDSSPKLLTNNSQNTEE